MKFLSRSNHRHYLKLTIVIVMTQERRFNIYNIGDVILYNFSGKIAVSAIATIKILLTFSLWSLSCMMLSINYSYCNWKHLPTISNLWLLLVCGPPGKLFNIIPYYLKQNFNFSLDSSRTSYKQATEHCRFWIYPKRAQNHENSISCIKHKCTVSFRG